MTKQALLLAEGLALLSLSIGPAKATVSTSTSATPSPSDRLLEAWHQVTGSLGLQDLGQDTKNLGNDPALVVVEQATAGGQDIILRRLAEECCVLWKKEKGAKGRVYLVAGWLVERCEPLLRSHSLLAPLVTLFTPSAALVPGWTPAPDAKTSIARALACFLTGLGSSRLFLDPGLKDREVMEASGLRRQVDDVIKIYLHCWEASPLHPLLPLLLCSLTLTQEASHELRDLTLKCLASMVDTSSRKEATLPECVAVLRFLTLALRQGATKSKVQELVLPGLLSLISRNLDTLTLTNAATPLLKILVRPPQQEPQLLTKLLLSFATKEMNFYSERCFKTLSAMVAINPDFCRRLIQGLQQEVVKVEARRGGGRDQVLRGQLDIFEDAIYNHQDL